MYIKRHNKRFIVCWWLILDKDKTRKTREPFWTSYWLSNSHVWMLQATMRRNSERCFSQCHRHWDIECSFGNITSNTPLHFACHSNPCKEQAWWTSLAASTGSMHGVCVCVIEEEKKCLQSNICRWLAHLCPRPFSHQLFAPLSQYRDVSWPSG